MNISILLRVIKECKQKQTFKFHSNLKLTHRFKFKNLYSESSSKIMQKSDENPFSNILKLWIECHKSIEKTNDFEIKEFNKVMDNLSLKSNLSSMVKFLNSKSLKEQK